MTAVVAMVVALATAVVAVATVGQAEEAMAATRTVEPAPWVNPSAEAEQGLGQPMESPLVTPQRKRTEPTEGHPGARSSRVQGATEKPPTTLSKPGTVPTEQALSGDSMVRVALGATSMEETQRVHGALAKQRRRLDTVCTPVTLWITSSLVPLLL